MIGDSEKVIFKRKIQKKKATKLIYRAKIKLLSDFIAKAFGQGKDKEI